MNVSCSQKNADTYAPAYLSLTRFSAQLVASEVHAAPAWCAEIYLFTWWL